MAKRVVLVLICLFIVSQAAFCQMSIRQTSEQFERLKKEMEKIRTDLESNNQKRLQILTNLSDLDKSLERLDTEKSQINIQLKEFNDQLLNLEEELKQKQSQVAESEKQLDLLREDAKLSFINIQKINAQSWWSLLFEAENLTEFWIRSRQIKLILDGDLKTLERLEKASKEHRSKVASLEDKKIAITKKKNELLDVQKKLQTNEAQIKKNLDEKTKALKKIEEEKSAYDRSLREMETASEELGKAIRLLQEKTLVEDGVKEAIKIIWPVEGRITSDYGWRFHPILNENRMHTGLDIAASEGVDIKAAAGGTVILAGWVSGYGLTTVISHGNNITTLYGHASKLLTQAGDRVKQGQVVAKVGSTGVSTGPHLHFEIRTSGDPVNPWAWLPVDN